MEYGIALVRYEFDNAENYLLLLFSNYNVIQFTVLFIEVANLFQLYNDLSSFVELLIYVIRA
jgi:hypothetical protein